MSIKDGQGREVVHLPGFWSVVIKAAAALALLAIPGVVSILWSVASLLWHHDQRISKIEYNLGIAIVRDFQPAHLQSHRDYLDTSDVAIREGVTARTILDWISKDRILPRPEKTSKGYAFTLDYRVVPSMIESTTPTQRTVQINSP